MGRKRKIWNLDYEELDDLWDELCGEDSERVFILFNKDCAGPIWINEDRYDSLEHLQKANFKEYLAFVEDSIAGWREDAFEREV